LLSRTGSDSNLCKKDGRLVWKKEVQNPNIVVEADYLLVGEKSSQCPTRANLDLFRYWDMVPQSLGGRR